MRLLRTIEDAVARMPVFGRLARVFAWRFLTIAEAVVKRLGAGAPTGFPLWKNGIEGDLMKGSVRKSPLDPLFQRGKTMLS